MELKFLCDGTRNSKWYYDGRLYIRKMASRTGERVKTYSKEDIMDFKDDSLESVKILKDHIKNNLDENCFDVV